MATTAATAQIRCFAATISDYCMPQGKLDRPTRSLSRLSSGSGNLLVRHNKQFLLELKNYIQVTIAHALIVHTMTGRIALIKQGE